MMPQAALHRAMIALAFVSFGTLVGTGRVPMVPTVLGFASLTLAIMQARGARWAGMQRFDSPQAWNVAVLMACLISATDFLVGSQDLLQASLYLLVLLMANKLLAAKTTQDVLHLFTVSFLQFLAAAVLTVDLWFAAGFVAYLVVSIWALLLYHLHSESAALMPANIGSATALTLPPRFLAGTAALALVTLGVTTSVFILIPRAGAGFFQRSQGTAIKTSGFSEKVDLGLIGTVKQDSTLVMRVQFPEGGPPPPVPLYFRGVAFDRYTGQSWVNTYAIRRSAAKADEGAFDLFPRRRAALGPRIRQDILIEALDTTVLFGLPFIEHIKGPFSSISSDGMGAVRLTAPAPVRFQYSVLSTPTRILNEDRDAEQLVYPPIALRYFLQLPTLSPRVADLAASITKHVRTPFQKVVAVKEYLRTNYRYTLDLDTAVSSTPVEDFLFTRKSGYCEHYATAMVILLRTLGIPARLVTGFLPGEWNEFGHYYAVRQQDAHAWVEVYFPHSGWITFDPTPSVTAPSRFPLFAQMASLVDSMRLTWDRFIIHYSVRDQIAVVQDIRSQTEYLHHQLAEALQAVRTWAIGAPMGWTRAPLLLFVVLMLATTAGLIALRCRSRVSAHPPTPELIAAGLYRRVLDALNRHGLSKPVGVTPREFSRMIADERSDLREFLDPLTDLYYRLRYGGESLSREEHQQIDMLLTKLQSITDNKDPSGR